MHWISRKTPKETFKHVLFFPFFKGSRQLKQAQVLFCFLFSKCQMKSKCSVSGAFDNNNLNAFHWPLDKKRLLVDVTREAFIWSKTTIDIVLDNCTCILQTGKDEFESDKQSQEGSACDHGAATVFSYHVCSCVSSVFALVSSQALSISVTAKRGEQ